MDTGNSFATPVAALCAKNVLAFRKGGRPCLKGRFIDTGDERYATVGLYSHCLVPSSEYGSCSTQERLSW